MDWDQVAANNYESLSRDSRPKAKQLNALFWLVAEWRNGGLNQYLINSASDLIPFVREAFEDANFVDGLSWIHQIEEVLEGRIPLNRDDRIDAMVAARDRFGGEDPVADQEKILEGFMQKINKIGEDLLDSLTDIDRNKVAFPHIEKSGFNWSKGSQKKGRSK